ncbi:MAG: VCBS repeat-containing protein [Flavobacteriaceae bacterium]
MKKLFSFLIVFILISCSKDPVIYTLTATANPAEGGSVSPSSQQYDSGDVATVTATPSAEYVFQSWSGSASGSSPSTTVTMDSDKAVVANFVKKKYALTINVEGEGSVTEKVIKAGAATDYNSGTVVELTAVPEGEWLFVEWKGDLTGSENPKEITIDKAKTVTAVFVKKQYPLTIEIEGEGTVSEKVIKQGLATDYNSGTIVELTAEPTANWEFVEWSGDITSTENPVQITIDGPKTVKVVFRSVFKEEIKYYKSSFENHHLNNLYYSPYIKPDLPGSPYVAVGFDYLHLNNDGYRDLIVKDENDDGRFRFYLSDENRNFSETKDLINNYTFSTFGARKIITSDFNNDNLIDIAYASAPDDETTEKGVFVLKNTGNGFDRIKIFGGKDYINGKPTGYWSHYLASADVNNDGNPDIIGGSMPYVYIGDGSFNFEPKDLPDGVTRYDGYLERTAMIEFQNIELFDINEDGFIDILGSLNRGQDFSKEDYKNTFEIFYGNGTEQFFDSNPYVFNSKYEGTNVTMGIAIDDMDNDGDYDIFVNSSFNYQGKFVIQYYQNNGDGTFSNESELMFENEQNLIELGSDPDWIKLVDVDNDGTKELMIEGGFGVGGGICCFDFNGFKINSNGKFERFLFNNWN